VRNKSGSLARSKATVGSDFASATNKQASTLLLKVQDISPYRHTLHLQEQMELKEHTLFDDITYSSPAFPMSYQKSQPIVFGMRLRSGDKTSVEAVAVFRSLIVRGVDWVHFRKCMVLPSKCRNYRVSSGIPCLSAWLTSRQTAKNANELEQGWSLGPLWRNSFVARLNAQESAQLLLVRLECTVGNQAARLVPSQLYLDFLYDPLLVVDREMAGVLENQSLYKTEKIILVVRKWRETPQGDLASAIFACWRSFRYDSDGLPNVGRDWLLLTSTLTRTMVSAEEDNGGISLTPMNRELFNGSSF
jgi:hypothetical protein